MAIRLDRSIERVPAIFGGEPEFPEGLHLVHPSIPDRASLAEEFDEILASGQLTNGRFVRRFEEAAAERLGVRSCVAVASCTSGLMLLLRASQITGDVIIPSFTFSATAHAVVWNGLRPVYADVDRQTLTIDPRSVEKMIGVRTSAILATHIYGTPCDVEALRAIASDHGIKLFFDAAHAFGSTHDGVPAGALGDAEVFSLSPTKVMVAGEGGLVATNDEVLAERLRIGRDYGNPGNYDCLFVGLNARMSEFHAALGLGSLRDLDQRIHKRNELVAIYRQVLRDIPGISFVEVPVGDWSTYKDFTVFVEADDFGMDAASLQDALEVEGIESRRYYSPPIHRMKAYQTRSGTTDHLPVTEWAVDRVLTLPLWTDMTPAQIARVADVLMRLHQSSSDAVIDLTEESTAEAP